MRVALIHDWLLGMRGGERCLEVLCDMFPEADIFTAFYNPDRISSTIKKHRVFPSSYNRLPGIKSYYRYLLPAYPRIAENISSLLAREHQKQPYKLVVSVSHCLAKNVRVPKNSYHLCYCLTPVRYIWDQYDSYFAGSPVEPIARRLVPHLQAWDISGSKSVDSFACISHFVAKRIERYYGRSSTVVYPPVRSDWILPTKEDDQGDGFLCVSALVPYKNIQLVIETFNQLKYKLTVVGSGPEEKKLRAIAGENIRFKKSLSDGELAALYRSAKALVFAAEEDFGMVPVEMLAAGRPVICYGKGGALETVRAGAEKPVGVYFTELTTNALATAVEEFIIRQAEFSVENCVEQSRDFSLARFKDGFESLLLPTDGQALVNTVPLQEQRAAGR